MSNAVLLSASGITKSYYLGVQKLDILRDLNFSINRSESVSIIGESGCGKSTLLHVLSTLDRADSGELNFEGVLLADKKDEELASFRNKKMGFVFQFHHLLMELTAIENAALPLRISGLPKKLAEQSAEKWLELLGLKDRLHHFPNQLSGGELQRVAIARALVNEPQILFADEPTGNLDPANSENIQEIFFHLQKELKLTLVVVTHDVAFARRFGRCLRLKDGRLTN